MPIDLAKFKKKPQFEPKKFDLQEAKKPKITLPIIRPPRHQKIKYKDKIEVTSDKIRTGFMLFTGEIPRNTIERVIDDLKRFLNDYELEKEGRKFSFEKK